jgi:two-component system, OmpR family, response regulator ResD
MTTVLIADDDPVVRDVVRRYLEREGHDVAVAQDGSQALQLLGERQVDVAVLDLMMPGPDGLTLCRSVRSSEGYRLPVILLTALGEEDDRIAGLEAGADDYLTKPFSPRELVLRIRALLRRTPGSAAMTPAQLRSGALQDPPPPARPPCTVNRSA